MFERLLKEIVENLLVLTDTMRTLVELPKTNVIHELIVFLLEFYLNYLFHTLHYVNIFFIFKSKS